MSMASRPLPTRILPQKPHLDVLRKEAKRLAQSSSALQLAQAQHQLAREYGCVNWPDLVRTVRAMRARAQTPPTDHQVCEAIRSGSLDAVRQLLASGASPYAVLQIAAAEGTLAMVDEALAQGAQAWMPDPSGIGALDRARARSTSPQQEAILQRLIGPRIDDPHFRRAVDAISQGDLAGLRALLAEHPALATARAEEEGGYAGPYFAHPHLIEFVAENPVRANRLPPNICDLACAILDAGSPPHAVDQALALTASGRVPRECGVQIDLIQLFVERGGDRNGALRAAVSEGEHEAAEALLELGAVLDAVAAGALGRTHELAKLLGDTSDELAAVANLAIRGGHLECVALLLDAGMAPDVRVPKHPYAPTLLHQAAWFGQRSVARLLVERGADPNLRDAHFKGCSADWAHHAGHADLAKELRQKALGSTPAQ